MYDLDEEIVINAFVAHLEKQGNPGLKVDCQPDEENRKSSDIDAIAGKFAIEHTSIDTLPYQRRDSARYLKIIDGIKDEFMDRIPYRLNLTFPYEAVQIGQKWSKIRDSLKEWIINYASILPDGIHVIPDAPGIPFKFKVRKVVGRMQGVYFSRLEPLDNSLPDRIRKQLEGKARKLLPYKKKGYTTILLVESNDFSLMNLSKMLNAVRSGFAQRLPEGTNQIWYAETDTDLPEKIYFDDLTEAIQKQQNKGNKP